MRVNKCPYCGSPQDMSCDRMDSFVDEDELNRKICGECGRMFVYTKKVIVYYEMFEADCLNGGSHKYELSSPPIDPPWVRCVLCGEERPRDEVIVSEERREGE